MSKPVIKLNLGSGSNTGEYFKDWINVDLSPHPNVDVVSRVEVLKFPNDFADEIYASHILEHFGHHHVPYVLMEYEYYVDRIQDQEERGR